LFDQLSPLPSEEGDGQGEGGKERYQQVLENTKEIHNTITNLNQQNREYYSKNYS
jgi:hypothetical protein